jgi:hypothetical protein
MQDAAYGRLFFGLMVKQSLSQRKSMGFFGCGLGCFFDDLFKAPFAYRVPYREQAQATDSCWCWVDLLADCPKV